MLSPGNAAESTVTLSGPEVVEAGEALWLSP